jgi:formate/nitrite transporter FocA (FNT family)
VVPLLCRYIQLLAHKKVSKGWGEVLVQGIFANWLVCIATWQANAAQDLTGKAVAVWLPISAFAMLGFEHCIGELTLGRPEQSSSMHTQDSVWRAS